MKRKIMCGSMFLLLAFFSTDKLIGRWESQPSAKGNVTGVVFKSDGTLEGYINMKPFVSGIYTFKDDVISHDSSKVVSELET